MIKGFFRGVGAITTGTVFGLGLARAVSGALHDPPVADLRGQVALVTGGSRGLGLAVARELAQQGCRVAICARDEQELARAQADLERHGAEVMAVPCDVSDDAQVRRMVGSVIERFGQIDIVVNNAGIIVVAPLESMSRADLERVMAVNFWGVLNTTLAVLPGMRARGSGRIVNITSIGGKIAVPHLLPYTYAKFAAVGFSEGLRAELTGSGITVTTVVPGLMRTGSYLHAEFGGKQAAEYRWFALLSSAPYPVTVSAERAAQLIVSAASRGEAEYSFPFTATMAARLAGTFPGVTADLLALTDRLLPSAPPLPTARIPGALVAAGSETVVMRVATALGRAAAARYNQILPASTGAAVPPPAESPPSARVEPATAQADGGWQRVRPVAQNGY